MAIGPPESPLLSVQRVAGPHADKRSKVAPGMEIAHIVAFRPLTAQDFVSHLEVVTDLECFLVPVLAVGESF